MAHSVARIRAAAQQQGHSPSRITRPRPEAQAQAQAWRPNVGAPDHDGRLCTGSSQRTGPSERSRPGTLLRVAGASEPAGTGRPPPVLAQRQIAAFVSEVQFSVGTCSPRRPVTVLLLSVASGCPRLQVQVAVPKARPRPELGGVGVASRRLNFRRPAHQRPSAAEGRRLGWRAGEDAAELRLGLSPPFGVGGARQTGEEAAARAAVHACAGNTVAAHSARMLRRAATHGKRGCNTRRCITARRVATQQTRRRGPAQLERAAATSTCALGMLRPLALTATTRIPMRCEGCT